MANSIQRFMPKRFRKDSPIVPVVRLSGTIMAESGGLRPPLSLASAAPLLEKAFSIKPAKTVAIIVNSPGGSPVQSRLIYKRIRDLAEQKNKHVLVFVEDVAASGGYMIACAGDEIFVDPSSIVGSIGVVSAGFGFTGLIDKIGVERRVYTSGTNKSMLDPFKPENKSDIAYLKSLQEEIHTVFKDLVKSARGTKLSDDKELFTGKFWTGGRSVELGLVDAIGDLRGVLHERYGKDVRMKLISASRGFFGRRGGILGQISNDFEPTSAGLSDIGAGAAQHLATKIEHDANWRRFGLTPPA